MRTYTQLTQEQRYQIWALMKTGKNQTEIAQQLHVHKSTISRELARNRKITQTRLAPPLEKLTSGGPLGPLF